MMPADDNGLAEEQRFDRIEFSCDCRESPEQRPAKFKMEKKPRAIKDVTRRSL